MDSVDVEDDGEGTKNVPEVDGVAGVGDAFLLKQSHILY